MARLSHFCFVSISIEETRSRLTRSSIPLDPVVLAWLMIMVFDRVCRNRFSCAACCGTPAPAGIAFAAGEFRTKTPWSFDCGGAHNPIGRSFDRDTIIAPNAIFMIIDPIIDLGSTNSDIL